MADGWTTIELVQDQLGPTVPFTADPAAPAVVDAANSWCVRKRLQAGYTTDDPVIAPTPAVAFAATLYAVALWRERASTDGFQSFEDLGGYQPTGGSYGQIRRLLGVGKAQVDQPDARRRWPGAAITPRWPA